MFSQDPENPVDEVEFKFLHPRLDGFWDWPKKIDQKHVSAKLIFYGPRMPEAPTKKRVQVCRRRNCVLNFV